MIEPSDSNIEKESPEKEKDLSLGNMEIESLKILHEGRQSTLTFIAERSFTATLQAVSLNVVALGGIIVSKLSLQPDAKILGSIVLIVFNFLVGQYLYFKDKSYQNLKAQFATIEIALVEKCPSIRGKIVIQHKQRLSTWSGTGLFIIAIGISCLCTVIALWKNFLSNP